MEEKKLTYKLIRAAAAGEPQAQEDILNEHTNSLAAIEEQKLSLIPAADTTKDKAWKPGGSRHDGAAYPASDLFDLRPYAGAVHLLFFNGQRLPDFTGQPAFSDGGSVAQCPGGDHAV